MNIDNINVPRTRILVVVRWPLGGIRTYMLNMFSMFPATFAITVLATSTMEDHALQRDCIAYKADLKLVTTTMASHFILQIFKELKANRYDIVLSQGFISSVSVYLANILFRVPHVLVIHGIIEPQYFAGNFGTLKRWAFAWMLSRMTVLYAVGNDILEHLYAQFPHLKSRGPQAIVIPNGIDQKLLAIEPEKPFDLRETLGIDRDTFLFGFFGRFMQQKGFDLLIEAIDILKQKDIGHYFAVVAVGSGDYLREYKAVIKKNGLERFFYFLPFQPTVYHLYSQIDTVVMPSRWEAASLLAMEVLCVGVPLITSDCIGLRETVANTPAKVFPAEKKDALADLMLESMRDSSSEVFRKFVPVARSRYDVKRSSERLVQLVEDLLGSHE